MLDPVNVQKVETISQLDTTSEIAGAAAVKPAYIVSDVPTITKPDEAIGIDQVSISTSVAVQEPQAGFIGPVDYKKEMEGYIQSIIEAPITPDVDISGALSSPDNYDMNSLSEINSASQYIDPTNSQITSILSSLKDSGIITADMSNDEMAMAIHNYVSNNYTYQPEKAGDKWQKVGDTIRLKGGDCEDLANLEASLLIAGLMDRGMSLTEASNKVSNVVLGDVNSMISHTVVSYKFDDGQLKYLDPSIGTASDTVKRGTYAIFGYSASGVKIIDQNYSFLNLQTAGIDTIGYNINQVGTIQDIVWDGTVSGPKKEFDDARMDCFQTLGNLQMSAEALSVVSVSSLDSVQNAMNNVSTIQLKEVNEFKESVTWLKGISYSQDIDYLMNNKFVLFEGSTSINWYKDTTRTWDSWEQVGTRRVLVSPEKGHWVHPSIWPWTWFYQVDRPAVYRDEPIMGNVRRSETTRSYYPFNNTEAYNAAVRDYNSLVDRRCDDFTCLLNARNRVQDRLNDLKNEMFWGHPLAPQDQGLFNSAQGVLDRVSNIDTDRFVACVRAKPYVDQFNDDLGAFQAYSRSFDPSNNETASLQNKINQLASDLDAINSHYYPGFFGGCLSGQVDTDRWMLKNQPFDCTQAKLDRLTTEMSHHQAQINAYNSSLINTRSAIATVQDQFAQYSIDNMNTLYSQLSSLIILRNETMGLADGSLSLASLNDQINSKQNEINSAISAVGAKLSQIQSLLPAIQDDYNDTVNKMNAVMSSRDWFDSNETQFVDVNKQLTDAKNSVMISQKSGQNMIDAGVFNASLVAYKSMISQLTYDTTVPASLITNIKNSFNTMTGCYDKYTSSFNGIRDYMAKNLDGVQAMVMSITYGMDAMKNDMYKISLGNKFEDGKFTSGSDLSQAKFIKDYGESFDKYIKKEEAFKAALEGANKVTKNMGQYFLDNVSRKEVEMDSIIGSVAVMNDGAGLLNSKLDYDLKAAVLEGMDANLTAAYDRREAAWKKCFKDDFFAGCTAHAAQEPGNAWRFTHEDLEKARAIEREYNNAEKGLNDLKDQKAKIKGQIADAFATYANAIVLNSVGTPQAEIDQIAAFQKLMKDNSGDSFSEIVTFVTSKFMADQLIDTLKPHCKISDKNLETLTEKILIKDITTGYYTIQNGVVVNIRARIEETKAGLMTLSAVFETLRDLRGLIVSELMGPEEEGFKGQDISKLCEQKVKRAEQGLQQFVMNAFRAMQVLNQTKYTTKMNGCEAEYLRRTKEIDEKSEGFQYGNDEWWNKDERQLEAQDKRLKDSNQITKDYKDSMNSNFNAISGMLQKMGYGSGSADVASAIGGLNHLEQQTTSTKDDNRFTEVNRTMAESLRNKMTAVTGRRRGIMTGLQTKSNMRNLVHQEMTGVSGRSSRLDLAIDLNESEGQGLQTWFDMAIDLKSQEVDLKNQMVRTDINIEKTAKQLEHVRSAGIQILDKISKGLKCGLAAIGNGIGWLLGGEGGWNGTEKFFGDLLGGIAGLVTGSTVDGIKKFADAVGMNRIEKETNSVPIFTQFVHAKQTGTSVSGGLFGAAAEAERSNEGEAAGMNWDKYGITHNDGHADSSQGVDAVGTVLGGAAGAYLGPLVGGAAGGAAGSGIGAVIGTVLLGPLGGIVGSAIGGFFGGVAGSATGIVGGAIEGGKIGANIMDDIVGNQLKAFSGSTEVNYTGLAYAKERLDGNFAKLTIFDSVRKSLSEMRNLVHQEMTGIGGRSASNMTTYAIESARSYMGFVTKMARQSLEAQNTSKNEEYQKKRALLESGQNLINSFTGMVLSFAPIVGPAISNVVDMYTKEQNIKEQNKPEVNTRDAALAAENSAQGIFLDTNVKDVAENGIITLSDGKSVIDQARVGKARDNMANAYVAQGVINNLHKVESQLRTLTHMQLTGVGGRTMGEIGDKINASQFETAMETLDMITASLGQKTQIMNKKVELNKQLERMPLDYFFAITGPIIQVATIAISAIAGAATVLTLGAAAPILVLVSIGLGVLSSVMSTIKAARDYSISREKADKIDTGEIMEQMKWIDDQNKSDPNSNENKIKSMEKDFISEIANNLDTIQGFAGVNVGKSSLYKRALEKVAQRQKIMNTLTKALNNLRNEVQAVMTGIGGVTSDSTAQAISGELKAAQGKIDDSMKVLSEVATKQMEKNDAEMQATRASLNLCKTIIMSSISIIVSVVGGALKLEGMKVQDAIAKKVAAAGFKAGTDAAEAAKATAVAVKDAEGAVSQAYQSLDEVSASGDPASISEAENTVAGAENALSDAQNANKLINEAKDLGSKLETLNSASSVVTTTTTYTKLAVELAMNFIDQTKLEEKDSKVNEETKAAVKKTKDKLKQSTEKADKLLAAASEMGQASSLEDFTASAEMALGEAELTSSKIQYDRNAPDLKKEFREKMTATIGQLGQTLYEEAKTELKKPPKVATKAAVDADVKTATDAAKSGNVGAVQQAIGRIGDNISNFLNIQAKPSANTSNALQRADELIKKANANIQGMNPNEGLSEADQKLLATEKPTVEQLKKMLDIKKAQLANIQKNQKITAEAIVKAQESIAQAEQALGQATEALDTQKKETIGEIEKYEGQLQELKDKMASEPGMSADQKKLVEAQISKIQGKLETTKKEWESGKALTLATAQSGIEAAMGHLANLAEGLEALTNREGALKKDIASLALAIKDAASQGPQEGPRSTINTMTNMYNSDNRGTA